MSLLVLQRVFKRFRTARRDEVGLRDVSLEIAAREFVAVWGMRRSGRTTLLRVAGGLLPPDAGVVCFDGRPVDRGSPLGAGLGYCSPAFSATHGGKVADHVGVGLLAQGLPVPQAITRAEAALERAGIADCARLDPRELHPHELVRAGIARALVSRPKILLLDEPTSGVDLLERDPLLDLLRSLADDGIAILATVGETVGGVDRLLVIDAGVVRGNTVPGIAPVVALRRPRAEPGA